LKLVGVVCSTPIDHQEYFALTAVALCAIKATPLAEVEVQHREAMRLLSHFRDNLDVMFHGIKRSQIPLHHDLSSVLLPLLQKHADKALSLRLLQLWGLQNISKSLLVPEGLSSSE
jgi:predicted nuclease with TOPRIM domain